MSQRKNNVKLVFRFVVMLGLLVFVIMQIRNPASLSDIYNRIQNMNYWYLLTAAAVFFISILFSVKQWQMLLEIQNIKIPYKKLFHFYFVGLFFNNFLPSNWGGDIVRLYDTSVYTKEWEKVTSSILVDRLLGFFSLFFIGFLTLVLFYTDKVSSRFFLIFFILLLAPVIVFLVFDLKLFTDLIEKTIKEKHKSRIRRFIVKFLLSIRQYQKEKEMLSVFFVSLLTQFLRIGMNIFVAYALSFYLPLQSFFIIVPIIGFASAIPLSIAGIGQREMAGKWGVDTFLPGQHQTIVIFFTMGYLVIVAVSLIGGGLFLYSKIKKDVPDEL